MASPKHPRPPGGSRWPALAVAAALALGLALTGPGPQAAAAEPVPGSYAEALAVSATDPTAVPAGADDADCRPTRRHPRPVVLVHGTASNSYATWAGLAPRLARTGYCVFTVDHGAQLPLGPFGGTAALSDSAHQVQNTVFTVLQETGAEQVDLVTHGSGGLVARHVTERLTRGRPVVRRIVALAPPNRGVDPGLLVRLLTGLPGADSLLGIACAACTQQLVDSDYLASLNRLGEVGRGVRPTVIASRDDHVVPPSRTLLRGRRARTVVLQDVCPDARAGHRQLPYDRLTRQLVRRALDPRHARRPSC
jgi:triacylglycerol esterase/lipase EstA (alpha/beta hydrolase family)